MTDFELEPAPAAIGETLAEGGVLLRRELNRFDTIFFLISAMVAVDTIAAVAVGGGQAFTWLAVLFVTFFVPSALATAELGAAIPEEGGPYVWARMAFGRFAGSLTSLLYWASLPMWLGGSVAIVAVEVWRRFVTDLPTAGVYVFGTVFVALATLGAVLPLRWGKWLPTTGAIGQVVLLVFFTVSVGLYGAAHGVHGISAGDLRPSWAAFLAVVPVLLYSFVGVELPSAASEELRDPRRDIPAAIARAGVAQALMYGIPILAVLVVLPADEITSLHGLIDAMERVFTVYGGTVAADGSVALSGTGVLAGRLAAVVFIWVLLASGAAWIIGAGRTQAAACLDGAGPRAFGRLSPSSGVPVVMGLVSGVATLVTMVAALVVTGADAQRFFTATLTASIVLIVLAYLVVYPAFLVMRLRRPELERPFRAPGGRTGAWLITVVPTAWSLLTAATLLWPAALPGGFGRFGYELLVVTPALVVLAACALWELWSRRQPSGT
jgi:amino acid transporter